MHRVFTGRYAVVASPSTGLRRRFRRGPEITVQGNRIRHLPDSLALPNPAVSQHHLPSQLGPRV
jgi:hypothetical protein